MLPLGHGSLLILRLTLQSAHLNKVPAALAIGRCQVSPAVSARNIGVIFDETMSMDKQIRQVCKSTFHQLHNIRSIRKFLDRDALQTLVHALVTYKLDSFNSLYSGLPVCQIMKLQRVQNAAARVVLRIPRSEVGKTQPYGCALSMDADIWESPLLCCCFSAVESASRLHQEAREHGGFQGFT